MAGLAKLRKDKTKNKMLVTAGIMHSARAFTGPEVLHIDLTNWCNYNCIACWCRSPLLRDKAMPDWEKKLIIPLEKIKGIFDDIDELGGLRQVKLVGGGEPFMHPDILKIVEHIRSKDRNIEIDINTNFSLVTEDIANRLLELGVGSFTVSLWAGSGEAYAAVHPNQSAATFEKIARVLKFISARKKELHLAYPRIVIHDVVFNKNYRDVRNMLEFALDIGADDIQFVPVDPVKDRTESLLLNDTEKAELLNVLREIAQHYNPEGFRYTSPDGRSITLSDFLSFIRRIEKVNVKSGAYDEEVVDEIPCYVGWLFARVMATGNVVPCCKGHRMTMGNIYKNRFKEVWLGATYNRFRKNCLKLSKADAYFSAIGNDAAAKTGCYNCDNLWQNFPMHNKITALKQKNRFMFSLGSFLLRGVFLK